MILCPFFQSVYDRADANRGVMNSFKNSNAEGTMKETFLQDFDNNSNGYIEIAQLVKEIMNAAKKHCVDYEVSPIKPTCS